MKLPTIYKRTSTGAVQEWTIEVLNNQYRTISGQIDGKKVVSEWTVVEGKNAGKANATTAEEQALKEAQAKHTQKLEKGYFASLTSIDEETYIKPMLAKEWEKEASISLSDFPIYSQPKLDGIRCIATSKGLTTRNGKAIVAVPHIEEALKPIFAERPHLILDGELYADSLSDNFNEIVSLTKKTKPTAADLIRSANIIQYHIYDIVDTTRTFSERDAALNAIIVETPILKLVRTVCIATDLSKLDFAEIDRLHDLYVQKGYEGQMIRLNTLYENKRSKGLLKHKSFQDEEFEILEVGEGEGNKTGTAAYMTLKLKDGRTFSSNIKCSREEGAKMLKEKDSLIGKSATCKFFNLTPDGIPRFPYVIRVAREDYE